MISFLLWNIALEQSKSQINYANPNMFPKLIVHDEQKTYYITREIKYLYFFRWKDAVIDWNGTEALL